MEVPNGLPFRCHSSAGKLLRFTLPTTATAADLYQRLESWKESGLNGDIEAFLLSQKGVPLARGGPTKLADFDLNTIVDNPVFIKNHFNFVILRKLTNRDVSAVSNYLSKKTLPTLIQELFLESNWESLKTIRNICGEESWGEVASLLSFLCHADRIHPWGMHLFYVELLLGISDLFVMLRYMPGPKFEPDFNRPGTNFAFSFLANAAKEMSPDELVTMFRALFRSVRHAEQALDWLRDHTEVPCAVGEHLGYVIWSLILDMRFEDVDAGILRQLCEIVNTHRFDAAQCRAFVTRLKSEEFKGRFNTLACLLEYYPIVFRAALEDPIPGELFLEVAKYCNNIDAMQLLIDCFPHVALDDFMSSQKNPLVQAIQFNKAASRANRLAFVKLLSEAGIDPGDIQVDGHSPLVIAMLNKDLPLVEIMLPFSSQLSLVRSAQLRECLIGETPIVEVLLAKYSHLIKFLDPPVASDYADSTSVRIVISYRLRAYATIYKTDPRWQDRQRQWKDHDHAAWKFLTRKGINLLHAAITLMKELPPSEDLVNNKNPGFVTQPFAKAHFAYTMLNLYRSKWDTVLTETLPFFNDPDRAGFVPETMLASVALLCCHHLKNAKGCRKYAHILEFGPRLELSVFGIQEIWKQYHDTPEPSPSPKPAAAAKKSGAQAKKAAATATSPVSGAAGSKSPSSKPADVPVSPAPAASPRSNKTGKAAKSQATSPPPPQSPATAKAEKASSPAQSVSAKEAALNNQPFNAPTKPTSPKPHPSEPASNKQEPPKARECAICMERHQDHALVPCGHIFCGECAKSLHHCAQCRAPIATIVKLFFT